MEENYPAAPLALPRVSAEPTGVFLPPGHSAHTLDAPSMGKRVDPRGVDEFPHPRTVIPRRGDLLPARLGTLLPHCSARAPAPQRIQWCSRVFLPCIAGVFFNCHRNLQTSQCMVRISLLRICFLGSPRGIGACNLPSGRRLFWGFIIRFLLSWCLLEHGTDSAASVLGSSHLHPLLRVGGHRLPPICPALQRAALDVSSRNILPIAAVTALDVQNANRERCYRPSRLGNP